MAPFSDSKSDKLGFQSVAFRTCCLCNLTFNKPPQSRHANQPPVNIIRLQPPYREGAPARRLGDDMDWMLMPLLRYADFSGRSQRMEYWLFTLFYALVIVVLLGFAILFGSPAGEERTLAENYFLAVTGLWVLGTIIPSIAVTVRRLHDQDKSGWYYFISFVPYVGGIVMLIFMCLDGTSGPNRYGPDPKGGLGYGDVFA